MHCRRLVMSEPFCGDDRHRLADWRRGLRIGPATPRAAAARARRRPARAAGPAGDERRAGGNNLCSFATSYTIRDGGGLAAMEDTAEAVAAAVRFP